LGCLKTLEYGRFCFAALRAPGLAAGASPLGAQAPKKISSAGRVLFLPFAGDGAAAAEKVLFRFLFFLSFIFFFLFPVSAFFLSV